MRNCTAPAYPPTFLDRQTSMGIGWQSLGERNADWKKICAYGFSSQLRHSSREEKHCFYISFPLGTAKREEKPRIPFSSHLGSRSREENMRARFFLPFADSILHRTQIADIRMGHPTGGWPIGNGLHIDCNGLADQTRSEASSVAPTPSRSTRIAWPSACETP